MLFILIFFIALNTAHALADNQTQSYIDADDYTAYENVKDTYKVILKSNSTPLSKKTIKFTLNNKTTAKKTNSKGVASIDLNLKAGI